MALDLVQIGFEVQAKGLDEANQKTDKLIDKFGGVGEAGEKAAARFEKAQERLRSSIQKTEKTVEYMNKGFSSSVASKSAAFKVAGVSDSDIKAFQDSMKALEIAKRNASTASDGFSALNSNLASLSSTAKKTQSSFDSLMSTAGNIAKFSVISTVIYALINSFTSLTSAMVSMADEYTSVQNRLKLYIKDTKELADVNAFAAQASIENNVGLKETATLFARLAPAMKNIGANTAATKNIVDAFGKSMRIGGATLREAEAATIQFSQAMASGKLAGDEFRSISEASPRFLKAIADGSGIAASKLKEMSAAGKLTTEVIARALLKEYKNLTKESEDLGYSLEQGTNAIKVGFMSLVGEFNEGAGITKFLGSTLAELGISMVDGASGAKQLGEQFKAWASSIKEEAVVVLELLKVTLSAVASILIGRMVAALVATSRQFIVTTVQTLALNVALSSSAATATRTAGSIGILATATRGLAAAGTMVKGAFGGWVGLVATVASAVIGYNMFKDSTSELNDSLVQNNKYISMTKEELAKLDEQQRRTAKFKVEIDVAEANKNIEKAKKNYLDLLESFSFVTKNRLNLFDPDFKKGLDEVREGLQNGSITFNEATQRLVALGAISKEDAVQFNKMSEEFDKTVDSGVSLARVAKDLGLNVSLSNDAASNGVNVQDSLKSKLKEVEEQAKITGSAFSTMAQDFQKEASDLRATLTVMKVTGLPEDLAGKVASAAQRKMDEAKLLLRPDAKVENFLPLVYQEVDAAKELQQVREERSDINSYPEQLALANRMLNVLKQTNDMDLARIASQKDYVKWYGNNLGMAQQLVAVEKERKKIEDAIQEQKKKDDAAKDLNKQLRDYEKITVLMDKGFNLETAKKTVAAGFGFDDAGIKFAQKSFTHELELQQAELIQQALTQEQIGKGLAKGKTLAQATTDAISSRNKHLTKEQKIMLDNRALLEEELLKKEASNKVIDDSNKLSIQAADYAILQNNAYGDIANSYAKISLEDIKRLHTSQMILDKIKEQNEYLKQQKENPFANVDFEVFGDFGNPFKSALDGLNSLLTAVPDLEDKYNSMFASLDEKAKLAAGNKEELAKIDATRASLEAQYIVDNKKLQDKSITGTLSLAKSFFKENSKGYKIVSGLEKAYQASKIAFALWEKKDYIATLGMKIIGYAQDAAAFVMGSTTKIAAQSAQNVVQAQGAVASAANAPPPVGFAAAAAMIALLAGIGIAIGGGKPSGSFEPTNDGTGSVFGDTEAKSESIKKALEILADNSRVELPITSAMLKSLRNIENSFGGLTNLLIRENPASGLADSVAQGSYKTKLGESMGVGISMGVSYLTKVALAKGTAALIASGGAIGGAILSAGSAVISTVSSAVGASISAVAGAFSLGIGLLVGQVIGKPIAKLVGKLFGKKQTVIGQGLYGGDQSLGNIVDKGFNLKEYVDIETKKKKLGRTKTSYSTRYGAASGELTNQFSLIFRGFYDAMLQAAPLLTDNIDGVVERLRSHIVKLGKIDLKGLKGDEIQEKIEAVFGKAADEIARAALPFVDDFQKVGEGYFETVVRVASGIESAIAYTSRLNVVSAKYTDILNRQGDVATEIVRESVLLAEGYKGIVGGFYDLVAVFDGSAEELTNFVIQLRDLQDAIVATGKNGDYLTSTMFLGAGGLDRLSNGLDAYFEMLSPAEQAAELTRRLANEFEIFGLQLPADIKAFRNLVNGIDISTESGQKLYGQVIALAPEFNDLQDSLENANSAVNDLVKSLRDLAEEARKARGETQQPRNLASIRSEFDATAALAMQGDMTAAQKLLTLGKDLMQVSKQYSVSGSEYAKDLATIQKVATVSADVQELGLGYTPTTSLTPLASAGTQTVETVNSTTDAKLEALRADLITAITAVAKYTQDTAQRLQRWDYGDKMNVHVEQEVGDSPIKVQTV